MVGLEAQDASRALTATLACDTLGLKQHKRPQAYEYRKADRPTDRGNGGASMPHAHVLSDSHVFS
jgi:hypothetical protein